METSESGKSNGIGFEAFLDGLCGRLGLPDTATFDDILDALDKVLSAQNTREYLTLVKRARSSADVEHTVG